MLHNQTSNKRPEIIFVFSAITESGAVSELSVLAMAEMWAETVSLVKHLHKLKN